MPTNCISVCLARFEKKTAITFLRSLNRLFLFLQPRRSFYRGVRIDLLNINQVTFCFPRGGPSSTPGQSMWDLRWKNRQWNRVFSEYFSLPLCVSFHQYSTQKFIGVLFLLERWTGKAWEPSNSNAISDTGGWPSRGSCGLSPASYHKDTCSIPGQYMKFEVDKVALGEVSRRVLVLSLLSIILRMLHTHLQLDVAVTKVMYVVCQ